ncbi:MULTISPECIES: phage protein Gp37 [unclassified Thioalkalivibrio]|uniref:phage tail terminator protein n=1 Tax=unclassified Thioalkalivibrio TaxID=2621013 RepID=UPI00036F72A0|nr:MULTISPECIES: phage protein Gp37 [unclassified Thioalkalivibrio]
MSGNLLAAEGAILEQCKAALGDAVATYGTMTDMQTVEERSQRTPALYVVFDGYRPGGQAGAGRTQQFIVRWLVVVAVRNVGTEGAAQGEAGALVGALIPALMNFRPDADHGRLQATDPPAPVYREGFAYIPTAWEVTTHTTTDNRSTT